MDINTLACVGSYTPPVSVGNAAFEVDESLTAVGVSVTVSVDNADPKASDTAAVYEPAKASDGTYKPDTDRIKQLWDENDAKLGSFRNMVETLLNRQAQKYDIANNWLKDVWSKAQADDQEHMIEVDEETRAAAAKEIEEGGYYSVNETAKRLLDFAVALSGGDPDKAGLLRDAVDKGFKDVEDMWGGELPEISQQTYDAVMNGFDEWEEAGNAGAIGLLQ